MFKKIIIILLIIPFSLIFLAFSFQTIASWVDFMNTKPVGRLVDIDGNRKMHIYCSGEGEPTVILDASGDGTTAYWGWIQPLIAEKTRVCSYDRAGHGWSDRGPQPQDGLQTSKDLALLLEKAHIKGPYLLVGHSFGTSVVRLFRDQHQDKVVGMVLLDPTPLYKNIPIPSSFLEDQESDKFIINNSALLSHLGLFRIISLFRDPLEGLPSKDNIEYRKFYASPSHWQGIVDESMAMKDTYQEVKNTDDLGSLPLIVISPTEPRNNMRYERTDINKKIATLSKAGVHYEIEGVEHGSMLREEASAQKISQWILEMAEETRK